MTGALIHGADDVVLVPRENNMDTARAVLARPAEYADPIVRAACIWLRNHGNWMDRDRAIQMLRALDYEARVRAEEEKLRAEERRSLLIMGLVVLVFAISVVAVDAAWGQHLAAGLSQR